MAIRYVIVPKIVGRSGTVWSYAVQAFDGDAQVGELTFSNDPVRVGKRQERVAPIGYIEVAETHRRQKVATRMYELAAAKVCRDLGVPLASDVKRRIPAEGFWLKQLAKGRARLLGARMGGTKRYVLSCPAPNLDGRRR